MIEMRRLKNVIIFIQTNLSFELFFFGKCNSSWIPSVIQLYPSSTLVSINLVTYNTTNSSLTVDHISFFLLVNVNHHGSLQLYMLLFINATLFMYLKCILEIICTVMHNFIKHVFYQSQNLKIIQVWLLGHTYKYFRYSKCIRYWCFENYNPVPPIYSTTPLQRDLIVYLLENLLVSFLLPFIY